MVSPSADAKPCLILGVYVPASKDKFEKTAVSPSLTVSVPSTLLLLSTN